MPENLDQVTAFSAKDVKIAGVRVATQHLLDLDRQAVHAAPHVGMTDRKPHPHANRDRDHRRDRTFRTRSNAAASTSRSTRIRRPAPSSISISPFFCRRGRRGAVSISAGTLVNVGAGRAAASLVISTATN